MLVISNNKMVHALSEHMENEKQGFMRAEVIRGRIQLVLIIALVMFIGACEKNDNPVVDQSDTDQNATDTTDQWIHLAGHAPVGMIEPAQAATLDKAIAEARATEAEARRRWRFAEPDQRENWFVIWAASTVDEQVEFVWVQPLHWSPFRVEGRLVSRPVRELSCDKSVGELVSFPNDELADWVFLLSTDFDGPRDGGFTVNLLEQQLGKLD